MSNPGDRINNGSSYTPFGLCFTHKLNAETDNDYITTLKATNTAININTDKYVARFFTFNFALEAKAQIQEKDKVKGWLYILVS